MSRIQLDVTRIYVDVTRIYADVTRVGWRHAYLMSRKQMIILAKSWFVCFVIACNQGLFTHSEEGNMTYGAIVLKLGFCGVVCVWS